MKGRVSVITTSFLVLSVLNAVMYTYLFLFLSISFRCSQFGDDEGKIEGGSQRVSGNMNYKECEGYSTTKDGFGVVLYHQDLLQLFEFL